MIRNFKSYIVVKEDKIYDDGLNNILEGLIEIAKSEFLDIEKYGGISWMSLEYFENYIEMIFPEHHQIFIEDFLEKNYKDIIKIAFKKYGLIVDGKKIINFGKTSKEKISKELNNIRSMY